MNKAFVKIDGKEYPCYVTMGAFLEFKKETGKEATEPEALSGMTDMIAWLWATVKSASRREKKDFPLTLEEFADAITPDELPEILKAINPEEEAAETSDGGGSKKKTRRS